MGGWVGGWIAGVFLCVGICLWCERFCLSPAEGKKMIMCVSFVLFWSLRLSSCFTFCVFVFLSRVWLLFLSVAFVFCSVSFVSFVFLCFSY